MGNFWGGKCYLTVAEVISFCYATWEHLCKSGCQRLSKEVFGEDLAHVEILTCCICIPLYITTWHVMHVYICGYMKCIICIYIYIYLPKSSDFVLIHHRNSPKKHCVKKHEGSGGIKAYPWKCGTNPLAVDRSRLNSLGRIASRHCHWVHCHSRDILPDKHLFFMASAKKNNLKLETFNDLFAGSFH